MAKKKNPVEVYNLICTQCNSQNYVTRLKKVHKNLRLRKFCSNERIVTEHKTKKA